MNSVLLSAGGIDDFLVYFALSLVLVAVFLLIYVQVTPYREFALIRDGNVAASLSLSGALLGFIIPLASAVAHSVSLIDMALWGVVALVVQLAAYLAARAFVPNLAQAIPAGKTASGVFVGALALGVGVLNAACMTY
jgi:putative membrane protein